MRSMAERGNLLLRRERYAHRESVRLRASHEGGQALPGAGSEKVSGDQHVSHVRQLCRLREVARISVADIEVGHRASSACHLANIAYRSGGKIRWDAKKEKILDDRKASKYLTRTYRKPWKLEV